MRDRQNRQFRNAVRLRGKNGEEVSWGMQKSQGEKRRSETGLGSSMDGGKKIEQ